MGFWDVVGRMVRGQPAFVAPAQDANKWDDDAPTLDYAEDREAARQQHAAKVDSAPGGIVDERGYKHPPVVTVSHVKTDINGSTFDLWLTFQNQSDRPTHLDKFVIFGRTFLMNYPLGAHEQRVVRVYTGKLLDHDDHQKAELYYRDAPTGDYFRADHIVEYHYDPDKTYLPNELKLILPIRDI